MMPHVLAKRGVLQGTGFAVFLAFVPTVNDAITAILGARLPTLQERFDAGPTLFALVVAVYWVASSVTQPLFGSRADGFGAAPDRRRWRRFRLTVLEPDRRSTPAPPR